MDMESSFFDTRELAVFLKTSVRTVEKWRGQRLIPGAVQVGRVWRFRKNEIEKRLLSGRLLLDKAR